MSERLEEIKTTPNNPANNEDFWIVKIYKEDFDWLIQQAERVAVSRKEIRTWEKAADIWADKNTTLEKRAEETAKRNKELEYASKYNGELNEFLQKRKLPPNTLGRHVVDVVMERVEELEKDIGNYKKACSALETLESYSRKETQHYKSWLEDIRDITTGSAHEFAIKALAGEPNET